VYQGASECYESFEVGFEFFVAGGESSEVLEARETAFDAVALSIEFLVVAALLLAVRFGRHDRNRSHGLDVVEDCLTVVALVGQHPDGLAISSTATVDIHARTSSVVVSSAMKKPQA
jgi:hypothetical protein